MKKFLRRASPLLLAVCLLFSVTAPSLAAGQDDIPPAAPAVISAGTELSLYADDKLVELEGAAPALIEIGNGVYCMVPLRGVMEALGAEVGYNADAEEITVEYGGILAAFPLRGAKATVTTLATELSAPYEIYPAPVNVQGRVLVPSAMLGDLFGLTVGTGEVAVSVTDFGRALKDFEFGSYGILDAYLAQSASQGAVKSDGTYSGSIAYSSETGAIDLELPFSGTLASLSSGSLLNGSLGLKLDLSEVKLPEDADETLQMVLTMLNLIESIDLEYIANLENGAVYLKSALLDLLGDGAPGAWYKLALDGLDLSALGVSGAGLNLPDVTAVTDIGELLYAISLESSVTAPGQSIQTAKLLLALYEELLSDKAFKNTGTDEKPVYSLEMNLDSITDATLKAAEKVGLEEEISKEELTAAFEEMGFELDLKLTLTPGSPYAATAEVKFGMEMDGTMVKLSLESASASGQETLSLSLSVSNEDMTLDLTFDCEVATAASDKVPASAPPSGSTIIEM